MPKKPNDFYTDAASVFIAPFLRRYKWLIELSRERSIDLFLLQQTIETLERIVSLTKENNPINVGLVIKNGSIAFQSSIIVRKAFHITDISNFFNLKNCVDGIFMCYILDEKGMISIGQIPADIDQTTCHLTLKQISSAYSTVAFRTGASAIEIYNSGYFERTLRKGVWMEIPEISFSVLEKDGFPQILLQQMYHYCQELSDNYKGGTFVVIKGNELQCCSSLNTEVECVRFPIERIPKDKLLELADLDGALIVNVNGDLIGFAQKLDAPLSTQYVRESGRGTRHNSAAKYSNAVDSMVFVVSEDGPISLYYKGVLFARCFEGLFGN